MSAIVRATQREQRGRVVADASVDVPLACPFVPGCPEQRVNVGQLAHHGHEDHGVPIERAINIARGEPDPPAAPVVTPERRAAVIADPYGLDKNGIKKSREGNDTATPASAPRPPAARVPRATPTDDTPSRPAAGEWGHGPRRGRARKPEVPTPITCPRCPNELARRFALVEHLQNVHGLNATESIRLAEKTERAQARAARTTTPKETSTMKEKPCQGCRKPFTPTGPRSAFCAGCQGQTCSRCKRRAGKHAPGCKAGDAKTRAKATGAGKTKNGIRAPRLEPAVRDVVGADKSAKAAAQVLLGHLERIAENLTAKIANVRELIAIL